MKKLFFFTILLFGQAHAADLYYCKCDTGAEAGCVAGSNSNDGLTAANAKETASDARSEFSSLSPGDTISFCKGGAWINDGSGGWINSSANSESNRVYVTSYSPSWGGTARPYFAQSNSTQFGISPSTSAIGYTTFSGFKLECTNCNASDTSRGFSINNRATGITIDDMEITGFYHGIAVLSDQRNSSGNWTSDIVVSNSEIHHNKVQGMFNVSYGTTIDNVTFHHNGQKTVYDHNLYVGRAHNFILKNSTLYKAATGDGEICGGTNFEYHGDNNDNVLIENNYFYQVGQEYDGNCWGISFYPGYGASEGWTNVTIRNNVVKNHGGNYLVMSSCKTCTIENNIFITDNGSGAAYHIKLVGPSELWGNVDNIVQNNSFYYANGSGTAITVGTSGTNTGIVLTNNAIHYAGTDNGFNCFNLPSGSFTEIDNNICYHPNAPSAEWENGSGNLAAWQRATGWDQNSSEANPGFIDPAKGDFRLSGSSSAINTGNTTYYAVRDFLGFARGTNPDIGAFEGLYNPPAATALYLQ